MERHEIQQIKLVQTEDGTSTFFNQVLKEHYHSIHGSYTESMHVYINTGLRYISRRELVVFEVGFGSGLNALLTLIESLVRGIKIHYLTIEKYPITEALWSKFILPNQIQHYRDYFLTLHRSDWNRDVHITNNFVLHKIEDDWTGYELDKALDLVYYDAFSYDKQPQMWAKDRFDMLYQNMRIGGVLTTYAAKGVIKNNMRLAGFKVERLPGAPGKRHIVRALKI